MTNNDTVICSGSSEQMKESLERCRYALESRGLKVSMSVSMYVGKSEGDKWKGKHARRRR